jgi:plastocyanin
VDTARSSDMPMQDARPYGCERAEVHHTLNAGALGSVRLRMIKRLTPTLAICCAAAAFAVVAAALDLGADTAYSAGPPAAVSADAKPVVTIRNRAFSLSVTSVKPGATVEVVNRDGEPHTLTAADDAFDTKVIDGGGTASFVAPTTPGTYRFLCNIHPSMKGELTVT